MWHTLCKPRWSGRCVVAAPGPSLTKEVAEECLGEQVIAVQDAYRLLPEAEIMYFCDSEWFRHHKGCRDYVGEIWTSHSLAPANDKRKLFDEYKELNVIQGKEGNGFSFDPAFLHYGRNSGFQAVNLALLFGATSIVLVGFDMRIVEGKEHFFGGHPAGLRGTTKEQFEGFVQAFEQAKLPEGIEIFNATPGSALKCFPSITLDGVHCGR